MKLTVIFQTRNRPELLCNTVNESLANVRHPETTLMVAADEDDVATIRKLEEVSKIWDARVHISIKPREDTRGEKYDRALTECPADIYLPAVDYAPILTPGFDAKIIEAASLFPDGIGCVYTPMANHSFPQLQGITQGLVDKLGYIYPPWFPFWFIDHWMDDLAKLIDRISFADIHIDCSTFRPQNTIGLRDLHFWCALFDAGRLHRRKQALDIIESSDFKEPYWRKEILLRRHPLVEYCSFGINLWVRSDAERIEKLRGEQDPPDERYLRIKARATKLLLEWTRDLEQEAALAA